MRPTAIVNRPEYRMPTVTLDSTEYRNGTGKVFTTGDRVKPNPVVRRGDLYEFRRYVEQSNGAVFVECVGLKPRKTWGKVYRFHPDRLRRTAKGSPSLTRKWLQRREEAEDKPKTGRPKKDKRAGPRDSYERLTCSACGREWDRRIKRGRKPKTCPDC